MASFSDKGEPSGCSSGCFTDEPDPPRETQSQKSLLTLIQPTSAAAERVVFFVIELLWIGPGKISERLY